MPESEQCGWCKDRFGLSWQITPLVLGEVMTSGDQAAIDRVVKAFLPMHKSMSRRSRRPPTADDSVQ